MIWFTADNHFGHENIIRFCNRPFGSVGEMDEVMIERWNSVVKAGDTVYHLGDFTLGGVEDAHNYLIRLNGHVYVLCNPWHHDKRWINNFAGLYTKNGEIELLPSLMELIFPALGDGERSQTIMICHYAMRTWEKSFHGSWHLYGHSHGRLTPHGLSFDVGVDCNDFRPVSLDEVAQRMQALKESGVTNAD